VAAGDLFLQLTTTLESLQATKQPNKASSERDKKIEDLEKKVKDLLRELQALRSSAASGAPPAAAYPVPPGAAVAPLAPTTTVPLRRAADKVNPEPVADNWRVRTARGGADEKAAEVALTRATYQLKAVQAEALGAFLREHIKATVMETKVEGENLIVTTTPEAQRTISLFIALVQGKVASTRTSSVPANVPEWPRTRTVAPAPAAQPIPSPQTPQAVQPVSPARIPPTALAPATAPAKP
jgi:hypothetical protein